MSPTSNWLRREAREVLCHRTPTEEKAKFYIGSDEEDGCGDWITVSWCRNGRGGVSMQLGKDTADDDACGGRKG